MAKGLDSSFIHYGIRKEDMGTIEAICEKMEIDSEWMKDEILRPYHAERVSSIEVKDEDAEKIVNNALQTLKS